VFTKHIVCVLENVHGKLCELRHHFHTSAATSSTASARVRHVCACVCMCVCLCGRKLRAASCLWRGFTLHMAAIYSFKEERLLFSATLRAHPHIDIIIHTCIHTCTHPAPACHRFQRTDHLLSALHHHLHTTAHTHIITHTDTSAYTHAPPVITC
jgi:hypothetical protein